MTYEIINQNIFLHNSYDQKDILKMIGCRYNKPKKAWVIDHNLDAVENLNIYFPDLKIPEPEIVNLKADNSSLEPFIVDFLYDHQKKSVEKAYQNLYFADLSEPGSGKTLTQIELILSRHAFPVLIICPQSIIEPVWEKELLNWYGDANVKALNRGSEKNKQILNDCILKPNAANTPTNFIFIISYDSVPRIENELMSIDWKFIILDESTKIKNHKSNRAKSIMKLRDKARYRSIMTGTVAPNGLLDVFNQFRFLNPQLFGESYYAFRNTHYDQVSNFLWIPKPTAFPKFRERIKTCSIQHKKRDCVDLPALVHETRSITMDTKQKKMYNMMKEEAIAILETGEFVMAKFMTTKMIKLMQIASGFVYHDEEVTQISNGKINEIKDIIEELGSEKIIIFCTFRHTQTMITEKLNEFGIMALNYGHEKGMKNTDILNEFENRGTRVLVANPASAGHGLNLQFCSNIIYAEHDFNLEYYEQSVQRIERIGQKNKMTIYHLETKGTIEKYVMKKLQGKIDINKNLDINELKKELS